MYGDRHRFEIINDDGLVITLKLPFSAAVRPVGLPNDQ
jgi:hypothetical protein